MFEIVLFSLSLYLFSIKMCSLEISCFAKKCGYLLKIKKSIFQMNKNTEKKNL